MRFPTCAVTWRLGWFPESQHHGQAQQLQSTTTSPGDQNQASQQQANRRSARGGPVGEKLGSDAS